MCSVAVAYLFLFAEAYRAAILGSDDTMTLAAPLKKSCVSDAQRTAMQLFMNMASWIITS